MVVLRILLGAVLGMVSGAVVWAVSFMIVAIWELHRKGYVMGGLDLGFGSSRLEHPITDSAIFGAILGALFGLFAGLTIGIINPTVRRGAMVGLCIGGLLFVWLLLGDGPRKEITDVLGVLIFLAAAGSGTGFVITRLLRLIWSR